jgi:unsaturated pyranuronate lyase
MVARRARDAWARCLWSAREIRFGSEVVFSINCPFARLVLRRRILKMKRENPSIEICPGITRRTIANGKTMYQMIATLAAGSRMPEHRHAQEQIVHILEGQMRLIVDGVPHELSTGDSFYLASNVPHGVDTVLPTRVLDTFSPPRDDYLAVDQEKMAGGSDKGR